MASFENEKNDPREPDGLGVKRAAQRKTLDELGIPPEQLPVEKMTYLTRILYKSSSCDKWAEHELDYILFFKDYNNEIIPQPNLSVFTQLIANPTKLDEENDMH